MGQVAAVCQVEAHKGIAGLQAGEEHSHIGLRTRVRLDIGILCTKELTEAVDGQLFDLVHHFAAAIVAGVGIAFCVFVGADTAQGFQHLLAHEVFGCNQFKAFALAVFFLADQVGNLNVLFHRMGYYFLPRRLILQR